jgi:hypothetical protein
LTESKFTFGVTHIGSHGFLYKRPISRATSSDNEFAGADGQFGIYYHHLRTAQSEDTLVWYGTGPGAEFLITGRPYVCSSDPTSGARRWLLWDIYRNTNPETEVFMVELPAKLSQMTGHEVGSELRRLINGEAKWITKNYSGLTHCE